MASRHHAHRELSTGAFIRIDREECHIDPERCDGEHIHVITEAELLDATFHHHPAFQWWSDGD